MAAMALCQGSLLPVEILALALARLVFVLQLSMLLLAALEFAGNFSGLGDGGTGLLERLLAVLQGLAATAGLLVLLFQGGACLGQG